MKNVKVSLGKEIKTMDNFEKILKIMKHNGGYITTKELKNNNINRYFLTKMVERKQIISTCELHHRDILFLWCNLTS